MTIMVVLLYNEDVDRRCPINRIILAVDCVTNSIALKLCEPVKRVSVLKFPVFCLKNNGKLEMYFHALNLCL